MVWVAEKPTLTNKQSNLLTSLSTSRTSQQSHIIRSLIILRSSEGLSDRKISKQLKIDRQTVATWRNRWLQQREKLSLLDAEETGIFYKRSILAILSDAPRPGAPNKFTAEQICQIINVACETPDDSGVPLSHWSLPSLAKELVKRKIVESISTSQLAVFLKSGKNKTTQGHRMDSYANHG